MTMTLSLDDLVRRLERELSRLDREGRHRRREEVVALSDAVLAAWCIDGTDPDDETLARLLVGLGDVVARDMASLVEPEQLRVAAAFWTDVALRAPDELAAPPWCISGLLRWQAGDAMGAIADAEMALDADPHYTMAGYLLTAAGHGLQATDLYDARGTLAERRARLLPDAVARVSARR